eukprot:TRINITY_DN2188_c0_g1_i2.p1 TRINITY_DN2188_c0_g1~~TRINITY_DN2188_c0_g1_i2.p1  ORF type:complete len:293 (-),score=34.82 TRINITY_DN2188_c0_g1_i2:63-941(-)
MSTLEFSLPQRQKRLPRDGVDSYHLVVPGDVITQDSGIMRGHGTVVEGDALVATVSGVVERVNKLVSVRPLRARYTGEGGDVVVGRITEVGSKRWKVDVNSRQDSILMLSSINLPGGLQRRRTNEDALQMRSFYEEDDLISAEVQQFYSDGAMALHTRSLKYGKLKNGQFVSVSPALIKRCNTCFHKLPCGIDVILGNNGYIWISETKQDEGEEQVLFPKEQREEVFEVERSVREKIARVRNAIVALDMQFIAIHPGSVTSTYNASVRYDIDIANMVHPKVRGKLTDDSREL